MEVKEFIATLEKMNFSLSVREGKLSLKGDKQKLSKEELEAIKTNKDVINYITNNKEKIIEYISALPETSFSKKSADIVTIYRLSGLQQGMLFHGLYDEGSGGYIEQLSCDLTGVNRDALLSAWTAVIKRHTILRSAFYYDSFRVPVQCVYREVKLPLTELDYRGLDAAAQQATLEAYETADRSRGFDFKSAPLMRLGLIRLDEDRCRMLWTSHHILFDGWSLSILMEEFLNTYELLVSGQPIPETPEDRYEDYIRYLERKDKEAEEQYWRSYLSAQSHGTLLPFVGTTTERMKGTGNYESMLLLLDGARAAQVQGYAQSQRLTVSTLMQGVWAYLLHKYTGSAGVLYGVVVSGRPEDLSGIEHRVGMYINTLPLQAVVDEEQETTVWLQGLQAGQASSREYQYTALQDIQRWSGIKGDLFDSLLVFENYPVSKLISSKRWSLQVENVSINDHTNYPLTISIGSSEELHISFGYNTDILDQVYVTAIKDQFEHVLLQVTGGSAATLKDIKLLTDTQEHQLLVTFNDTAAAYPKDRSITELFEQQAAMNPESVAVIFEEQVLTYKELNESSNQLAHYLRKKGVKEETPVPICIERSPEMIIGLLGILKAGGAYVPIDPEYPQERIGYMLEDTSAPLLLSSKASRGKLTVSKAAVLSLDEDREQISAESKAELPEKPKPDQLAYVIYTSGSTGKPKGVMIEHKSLLNYLLNNKTKYITEDKNKAGSFIHLSYTFDASLTALFMPLLNGKLVVIAGKRAVNVFEDANLLKYAPYDFIKLTPAHISLLDHTIPDMYKSLLTDKLVVGGEALRLNYFDAYIEAGAEAEVINEYGPTEATVGCSTYSFNLSDNNEAVSNSIPIGKPIGNTRIYILDGQKRLVPVGVQGELYIGGEGIARGYLNRAELTKERFIRDPFSKEENAKIYRTGDLGRWLPDGNIEYLGRIDDQVKVRGYRIELGEIESVLEQSGLMRQAVVLAKEDKQGTKRLVGYVVASEEFDKQAIQEYLGTKLPEYMVPALWIVVEELPLTPNGKIDKRVLPDPELTEQAAVYAAPRNETEQALAGIWQELLDTERIGIYDDFFDLGGDSLLAVRVISAIRRQLEVELAIKDVFDYPTIASLADQLQLGLQSEVAVPPIKATQPRPEHIPLSFSQERLWFIDRLDGSLQYHIPSVIRMKGVLNREALEKTLKYIINRHEVLRTVILEDSAGRGYQRIISGLEWELKFEDYTAYNEEQVSIEHYIEQLNKAPFDLSSDYMLRANLIKTGEDEHLLVATMHHIASDGWSTSILVKEVIKLYASYDEGTQPELPTLELQYADYAIWQQNYLQGQVLDEKLDYWKHKLSGTLPLDLPTDHVRPSEFRTHGASIGISIDKGLSSKLYALGQRNGATLYMTLLSAFKVLLYRYSGQEDICVGTPIAARQQQQLEGLIGFFVNTLALRSQVSGEMSFTKLLQEVKTTTLEAYAHQEVPFEKVVDAVVKERDMSRSPLFQVMFDLGNTPKIPELNLGQVELSLAEYVNTTSKFDFSLSLAETAEGLQGTVEYNTDLYEEETIRLLISHFKELLGSIVSAPEKSLGMLRMLTSAEDQQLLEFNNAKATYPQDKNIVDLFTEQALLTPEATALIYEDKQLTYKELDERSSQLANYLQSRGIAAGKLVPVCMERSLEMIVGIIGILKAGGAYVPVDPEYPQDRINYMLEDTAAEIVVSSKARKAKLQGSNASLIALDEDWELIVKESAVGAAVNILPNQLAYVIYTSGSTGRPKGVMVEHSNVVSICQAWVAAYDLNSFEIRLLQLASVSFDVFSGDICRTLLVGGTMIICPDEIKYDLDKLCGLIVRHKINIFESTPGLILPLMKYIEERQLSFDYMRVLIFGGDILNIQAYQHLYDLYASRFRIINSYGTTETTIDSLYFEGNIKNYSQNNILPIGKPYLNTLVYILNKEGQKQPVGIPGELYIGGDGVGRGYLNREELTAEKFIKDPFNTEAGAKLYRTGDLVRWLSDGNIEYLGRIDDQVKIRGYRIELGEIESALEQSGLVSQAIVLAREDVHGTKRLVGYVVYAEKHDKEALQEYLQEKLPDYMIPALWVVMDRLPLTPNGKVDKKALPDPEYGDLSLQTYAAPRDETETALVEIWQELLGLDRVSIYDNFFELGGHSLLVMRMVSAIRRKLEIELAIKDVFLYPAIASLAEQLNLQNPGISVPAIEIIKPRPAYIPLSFSQERLWFIDKLEGSVPYHIPAVIRLKGILKTEVIENTLRAIISRHEVLRSVILEDEEGWGYQQVMDASGWSLVYEDDTDQEETYIREHIGRLINTPFDLSSDFMLRANLVKTSGGEHLLVVTMHHIASDGWSTSVLVKEVIEIYGAYAAGRASQLQELPLQYADYAIWQRNWLQGEVLQEKLSYWKEKLSGVLPLDLPVDYVRPSATGTRGSSMGISIGKELTAKLQSLGQACGATLYMTMLSAFKVLLYRYSGQEDICVGTPVAGRSQQELEGLIGFFINTLALRSRVSGDMSFGELLQAVKTTSLEAYAHQEVPFEKVVDAVVKERDMSRSPLFQVMFLWQNTPDVPELHVEGVELSLADYINSTSKFDLSMSLAETASGLQGALEYNTDLYKEETIGLMLTHFKELLKSIAEMPEKSIGLLEMLPPSEQDQLLIEFNATEGAYPKERSVVDLYEAQVIVNPEGIAVVFGEESLSYGELNERSNQLARYLKGKGVKAETLVPICIERGLGMIVGLLGILKAGGAYVPIDPGYPQERIAYMLEDTGAAIIISSVESRERLKGSNAVVIMLDGDWAEISKESAAALAEKPKPGQLAYVIYTSGSTGRPKGVMIEHRSLLNLLISIGKEIDFTPGSSCLSVTTYSFDICYLELYLPLIEGAKLIIASSETAKDGYLLAGELNKYRPSHMQGTPSMWQMLLDAGWNNAEGVKMLIGGEAVKEHIKDALAKTGDIWNVYGPTETTIWSASKKLTKTEKVTIGRPIANTKIYLLNPERQLVPIGVAGELYIGGDGVARGYLNRAELTKERFIADPFSEEENARLYKTGDLGRWLPDGTIEYLGRIDDQVKVRGYRIELGEIESVLEQSGLVNQAVVLAKEDKQGTKRLVGYVVSGGEVDKQALQAYLQSKLPEYMVPGIWVVMEQLPQTPNGKTDRKALPEPEIGDLPVQAYAVPRNGTEQALAGIWEDLLGLERIGIYDNFFDLGGHSLLAMRVVSAVRRQLGAELTIRDLFIYPTIALLTEQMGLQSSDISVPPIGVITPRPEHIPLSFSQERLWFIDRLEGSVQYHLPAVIRVKGALNRDALTKTLRHIIGRHEVLRTVILEDPQGQGYQQILSADSWELGITKAAGWDEAAITSHIAGLIGRPFDLSGDYKLRADLIRLSPEEHILVVTMHHIASDGWSVSILVKEVVALYAGYAGDGEAAALPELAVQYADYAIWQRQYLQGEVLENKLAYWKQKLDGVLPLELPADYVRPSVLGTHGSDMGISIDKGLSLKLQALGQRHGATLYMTLLSAFKVLLYRYSGQEDICVGTPIAGRNQQELEGLIGFFVNTLALRSKLSGDTSFIELLQAVKTTTLEAYTHQEVPFEKVVDAVVKERDMSRSPLFQVMFLWQNTPEVPELRLGQLELTPAAHINTTSKFDLSISLTETAEGLQGSIEYNTGLYKVETIGLMISHFKELLGSIAAAPEKGIGLLRMLSDEEERQLVVEFNNTAVAYARDRSVTELFEAQAAKMPVSTAVVYEDKELSYKELNERSNQLAHYLRKKGVKSETLVPVCMERSPEMIIGLLGILKAEGAYVPIDPEYPQERISYMLEDTGAGIIISSKACRGKLNGRKAAVLSLDEDWELISKESAAELAEKPKPEQLAYVIYTSGSTGRPKGVMIEHKGIVNLVEWHKKEYELSSMSRATLMAGVGFDAFGWELWPYLSVGSTIYIIDNNKRLSPYKLSELFIANCITHSFISTALIQDFISVFEYKKGSLKYLITGGDKLSAQKLNGINYTLVNNYGPTENTVVATNYKVSEGDNIIPIGKPIDNTKIYLLDLNQRLVPVGVMGELYIGGEGLARGYLNKPELTKERFIKDPFSKENGFRLYKTGDLGRWLPDGNIEYLGRMDDQVKIRGYRIELGEIESVLEQSGLVRQAVVLAKEDKQGTKRLVGYVVAEGEFDKQALQAYLQGKLPEYMVPSRWVGLDHLPLTPNGKIDRRALPDPEITDLADSYVSPRNATEMALAKIWQELLGLDNVGVYDNFFELGGHSLLAMRVVAYIERNLSVSIPINMIFQFTTINDLSKYIEIHTKVNSREENTTSFKILDV